MPGTALRRRPRPRRPRRRRAAPRSPPRRSRAPRAPRRCARPAAARARPVPGRAAEAHGRGEQPHRRRRARLLHLAQLRGRQRLAEAGARAPGSRRARRRTPPTRPGVRVREDRLQLARDRRIHLAPEQVVAAGAAAERLPELRLERAEGDPAVGAGVGPVARQAAGELEPAALRLDAVGEEPRRDHRQPALRALRHRDVDELALAGAVALAQRGEDRPCRHQRAAADVGDLPRGRDGRPAGLAARARAARCGRGS